MCVCAARLPRVSRVSRARAETRARELMCSSAQGRERIVRKQLCGSLQKLGNSPFFQAGEPWVGARSRDLPRTPQSPRQGVVEAARRSRLDSRCRWWVVLVVCVVLSRITTHPSRYLPTALAIFALPVSSGRIRSYAARRPPAASLL